MRTKALFLAAATALTTLVATQAQVVYSVNVVGYINVDLKAGFNMMANQLDNGNGNLVTEVLGDQLPFNSVVYKWTGSGYQILLFDDLGWDGTPDALQATMAPGEGVFIKAASDATVTMVGEVVEGDADVSLPQGFSIFSSVAPVATDLSDAAASWPAEINDAFYQWNPDKNAGAGGYDIWIFDDLGWDGPGGALTLQVGASAWVKKVSAQTWTRNFTVPRQ